MARVLKESASVRDANLDRMAAPGCFASSPTAAAAQARESTSKEQHRPPPPVDPGKVPHTPQYSSSSDEHGSRRPWMPKMEFPKFDGEGVRIWLDNCEAYFQLYQIPESFKVMSASLHLHGNAAHWYQAYKLSDYCSSWSQFASAILQEFDLNMHRDCMRDLLVLKQMGTVQEYRNNFNQLVYQVWLYEGAVSETLLVTQFILGLKEEIRSAVEIQLPLTVNTAAEYALVQETVLERNRSQQGRFYRNGGYKPQPQREPM